MIFAKNRGIKTALNGPKGTSFFCMTPYHIFACIVGSSKGVLEDENYEGSTICSRFTKDAEIL